VNIAKDEDAPSLRWFATIIPAVSIIGMTPQLIALHQLPASAVVQLADRNRQGALAQAILWALSPSIVYACIIGVIFSRISRKLRDSANLDVLTGAHSRRYPFETTTQILDKSKDRLPDEATSLLLIDIDHFKTINDTRGHIVSERVRKNVAETPFLHGEQSISLTISIGVVIQERDATLESMLTVADKRLYRAKETGCNQVVNHGEIGLVI
jgi:GGDEF domain-containing protein